MSLSNRKDVAAILEKLLTNEKVDTQIKIEASQGLARTVDGQRQLIALAKDGKLPGEAKVLVGPNLRNSNDEAIRTAATELFPARKTSQSSTASRGCPRQATRERRKGLGGCLRVLPPVLNAIKSMGRERTLVPDLSEIGNKLSREAMYVSILEPSAGISHNYEAYMAVDDAGDTVTGLLVNQAGDEVTIRDAKSIERTFKKSELDSFKKSEKSLMPEGLQELMTEEGLVDLVEYLTTFEKEKVGASMLVQVESILRWIDSPCFEPPRETECAQSRSFGCSQRNDRDIGQRYDATSCHSHCQWSSLFIGLGSHRGR